MPTLSARARSQILEAIDRGHWVLLNDVHLAQSWMPRLTEIVHSIDVQRVHEQFRLWMISAPIDERTPERAFPPLLIEASVVLHLEPSITGARAIVEGLGKNNAADALQNRMRVLLMHFHSLMCHSNFRPGLAWQMPYSFTPWDLRTAVSLLGTAISVRAGNSRMPTETLELLCPFLLNKVTYGSHIVDPSDAQRVRLLFESALERSAKSVKDMRKGSIRRPSLNTSAGARRGSARGSVSSSKLRVSTGVHLPVSSADQSISSEVEDFVLEVFGQTNVYSNHSLPGWSRASDGESGEDIIMRAEELFMEEKTIETLRKCTHELCHVLGAEDSSTEESGHEQQRQQQHGVATYEDQVEESCNEVLTALPARIVLSAAHGGNMLDSQVAVSLVDSKVREEALLFNKTLGDIRADIELLRSAMRGECKPGPEGITLCDALSKRFVPAKWDIYAPTDGSLAISLDMWCSLTVRHRFSMQSFLDREHRIVMIGLFSWPRSLVASMYQEFARKRKVATEEIDLHFICTNIAYEDDKTVIKDSSSSRRQNEDDGGAGITVTTDSGKEKEGFDTLYIGGVSDQLRQVLLRPRTILT